MIRRLSAAAIVLALAVPALADLTATLKDSSGDSFVTLTAGSSFDVLVEIDTTESLLSGQFFLVDTSGAGVFSLTGVTFNDSLWSTTGGDVSDPGSQTLEAANNYTSGDIGTVADDIVNGTGTGTSVFVTLHLSLSNLAGPGVYTLNLSDLVFGNTSYGEVSAGVGDDYQVRVTAIPAPAAIVLGILGSGLIAGLRRRMA